MNQPKLWYDLDGSEGEMPNDRLIMVRHRDWTATDKWIRQRPYTPEPSPAQGWISLAERKPTEADADEQGRIIARDSENVWLTRWPDCVEVWRGPTHWLPLPKLTKPDPDKAAFEAAWDKFVENEPVTTQKGEFTAGWQAALDYRDGKGKV